MVTVAKAKKKFNTTLFISFQRDLMAFLSQIFVRWAGESSVPAFIVSVKGNIIVIVYLGAAQTGS